MFDEKEMIIITIKYIVTVGFFNYLYFVAFIRVLRLFHYWLYNGR